MRNVFPFNLCVSEIVEKKNFVLHKRWSMVFISNKKNELKYESRQKIQQRHNHGIIINYRCVPCLSFFRYKNISVRNDLIEQKNLLSDKMKRIRIHELKCPQQKQNKKINYTLTIFDLNSFVSCNTHIYFSL